MRINVVLGTILCLFNVCAFGAVSERQTQVCDGFRVHEGTTSGGGVVATSDYRKIRGLRGRAIRLRHHNYIFYARPYGRDLSAGWMELWFRPRDKRMGLIDINSAENDFDARYGVFAVGRRIWFESAAGGRHQAISRNRFRRNEWNHLIVAWNAQESIVSIYLNGKATHRVLQIPSPGADPDVFVGNHWWYDGANRSIDLDHFRIVRGQLSPVDATRLYDRFVDTQ